MAAAYFSGLATEYGLFFKKRKVETSREASFSSTSMADFVYKFDDYSGHDLDDDCDGGDTSEQVPKPKKGGNWQNIQGQLLL